MTLFSSLDTARRILDMHSLCTALRYTTQYTKFTTLVNDQLTTDRLEPPGNGLADMHYVMSDPQPFPDVCTLRRGSRHR